MSEFNCSNGHIFQELSRTIRTYPDHPNWRSTAESQSSVIVLFCPRCGTTKEIVTPIYGNHKD